MKPPVLKPSQSELKQKYENLLTLLRSLGDSAIAYSGGVDSTFLLAAAKLAPVDNLIALTMKRPYFADWELEEAIRFAEDIEAEHRVIEIPVDETIRNNPYDRCYRCKTFTFTAFWEALDEMGYDTLMDGTIADDTGEYRPGLKAVREQNVRSPLRETGFTKVEIRELCKAMDLPVWDKPSNTCLITRIPYNTHVSDEDFRQIEQAELFLIREGFELVRVRKHGDIARIEVDPERISDLAQPDIMSRIVPYFKSLGFTHVSIDMVGYKTGSLDVDVIKNSQNGNEQR